jgi:ATP-binding cassette subfamily B (MDR/TAP) protein 9
MYEQSSGTIKIDGTDVHELSPRWLSKHVSIVQQVRISLVSSQFLISKSISNLSSLPSICNQEPTLFARTIKRNIMYGLEGGEDEPSQEEIERVARLANCDDFIRKVSHDRV